MDLLHEIWMTVLAWLILAGPVALLTTGLWFLLLRGRHELLPPLRDRAAPWTGLEVILVLLGLGLWPALVESSLEPLGEIVPGSREANVILARSLGWLVHLGVSLALLRALSDTRPYQLGLHPSRWRRNVLLGSLAWLACSPLVHLVHFLTAWIYQMVEGQLPEDHLVVNLMRGESPLLEWALLLAMVLLIGPITEEFVFRGVLLRWASRFAGRGFLLMGLVLLLAGGQGGGENTPFGFRVEIILFVLLLWPGFQLCPLLFEWAFPIREPNPVPDKSNISDEESEENGTRQPDFWDRLAERTILLFDPARQDPRVNQPRAVYASAVLFAAVHPWPTPIPLFLLGLVLGWVAWRTQSLVAPVTLHVLFNAVACIELGLRM